MRKQIIFFFSIRWNERLNILIRYYKRYVYLKDLKYVYKIFLKIAVSIEKCIEQESRQ